MSYFSESETAKYPTKKLLPILSNNTLSTNFEKESMSIKTKQKYGWHFLLWRLYYKIKHTCLNKFERTYQWLKGNGLWFCYANFWWLRPNFQGDRVNDQLRQISYFKGINRTD